VIEKKRERERILRREKRRKHTEKEKTRHQVYFFPFCLYIHSWHKIKKSTHNYSYFINMHIHERIILQCFCIMFLPCISTVHPTMNLHHLSIPIIINQTTFYAMLTPLPKYTNQIPLTEKMQASKPFSEPYKHHISTKTHLTNTQEKNYLILYT